MHDRTILAAIVVRRLGFNHRRAWIDGYSLEPICLPALIPSPLPPAASPRPGPWTSPQIVRGEHSHARPIAVRNHLPTRVHRMHVHVISFYASPSTRTSFSASRSKAPSIHNATILSPPRGGRRWLHELICFNDNETICAFYCFLVSSPNTRLASSTAR